MTNQDHNETSRNNRSKQRSGRTNSNSNSNSRNNRPTNTNDRDDDRDEGFSVSRTGERLLEAARRNPEALVILAAGAAMLLRRGNLHSGGARFERDSDYDRDNGRRDREDRGSIAEAADAAGEFVTDAAGRVVDTAGAYVSTVSSYAEDGRRRVSREASRLGRRASRMASRAQASAERMLQGQPVAVAAFGLATGAVVAAVLPRSDVEQRTLKPARDALAEAASRAVETVKETAERRFSADGLKELAGDAAKIVTNSVLGKLGKDDDSSSDDRA